MQGAPSSIENLQRALVHVPGKGGASPLPGAGSRSLCLGRRCLMYGNNKGTVQPPRIHKNTKARRGARSMQVTGTIRSPRPLLSPSSGKVHTRRLFPKILRHVPLSPGAAWPPYWLSASNGERKGQVDSQKCLPTSLSFQASFAFENITAGWLLARKAHRQPQRC